MIRECPICSLKFSTKTGKKYCSDACQYEAMRVRAREAHRMKAGGLPMKVCPTCGKEYHPNHRNQRYCSQNCNTEPKIPISRACKWCGTLFMPTSHADRFCCIYCEDTYNKSKERPKKYDPNRVRKKRMETAKIVAKARKQGISYGEYMSTNKR